MDRKALAALLLAGALIGGCGGGDDEDTSTAASGPTGRSVTAPEAGGESTKPEKKPEKEKSDDKKSSEEEALERLPKGERNSAIRLASQSIAGANGLLNARVTVSADGHSVGIAVSPNVACAARPSAGSRTASLIKGQLPIVKEVAVTVGGRSFAAHRAGCRAPVLPGGSGSVVYSKAGTGVVDSPAFKVTAKRWTVAYRNDGGFFSVFVYKNGKAQDDVITTMRAGSGKKTFSGPGTFKLKISGGNAWAVTVRNGA